MSSGLDLENSYSEIVTVPISQEVQQEWEVAKTDADLQDPARLYFLLPSDSSAGAGGCYLSKRSHSEVFPPFLYLPEFDHATTDLHHIIIWSPCILFPQYWLPEVCRRLRHECEHAKQEELYRDEIALLIEAANGAVHIEAGGTADFSKIYHSMPTEQDANAASTDLIRARYDQAQDALRIYTPDLDRSALQPANRDTIRQRMVDFLLQYKSSFHFWCHTVKRQAIEEWLVSRGLDPTDSLWVRLLSG